MASRSVNAEKPMFVKMSTVKKVVEEEACPDGYLEVHLSWYDEKNYYFPRQAFVCADAEYMRSLVHQ